MNFNLLAIKAKNSRNKFLTSEVVDQDSPIILSILQQLEFIIKFSSQGKDPRLQLETGQVFTYSVIASKEFASPSEMLLKASLDEVSRIIFSSDY